MTPDWYPNQNSQRLPHEFNQQFVYNNSQYGSVRGFFPGYPLMHVANCFGSSHTKNMAPAHRRSIQATTTHNRLVDTSLWMGVQCPYPGVAMQALLRHTLEDTHSNILQVHIQASP